jgi:signal transduction histidine kinase
MHHLQAGRPALRDRSSRLQLLVLNAALYFSLSFCILAALGVMLAGQLEVALILHLPSILLYTAVLYVARRHCFLTARLGYLLVCHLIMLFGIYLYGKETNLTLFFLHLSLFPFLLFRAREWRWIVVSSIMAFVMFEITELELIPTGIRPLEDITVSVIRLLCAIAAFIGITLPAVLLLWQSNQQYRKAIQRNRVLAMDEKLAAIGRLAAGAAHEINNPLAIIRLTLQNLENVANVHEQRGCKLRLQKAYDAIQRIHDILQKLLASAHRVPIVAEPLCVNTIADLLMQRSQRYLHHHGIQLKVCVDLAAHAVIRCQQQHVIDAVDSLINNALEAMMGYQSPTISLTLRSQDEFFHVQVEDTGPGVSEEMGRSIFTPFFTTKEVGSGLGLSLYSARCIARQYGGDLTCDKGPGGRFCLSLPIQKLS